MIYNDLHQYSWTGIMILWQQNFAHVYLYSVYLYPRIRFMLG